MSGRTFSKEARVRSGQTCERIPSNAWARKIAAPTKPITTAVIVSNIANVLYATARQKTAATLHSQKDFRAPTHNPDRRGLWATDVHRLVIQRQTFGISRHAGHLTFMTVMRVMKRGE
jgi:hypothetical protein